MESLPVADYFDEDAEMLPVRVRPLPAGRMDIHRDGAPTGIHVPVIAYVIDTGAGMLLVDCGLSSRWRDAPLGADGGEEVEPGVRYVPRLEGPGVAERLREEGLVVSRLVCTHLHLDHAGGAAEVALPVEASREEIATAPRQAGSLLDGVETREIVLQPRPLGPFPRSLELAPGVIAVDTAGHTPGSISVFVCLGGAWGLICGDAVYPRLDEPDSPAFLGMLRVRRMLQDFPATAILAGHDPAVLRAAGDGWLGTPLEQPPG